MVDNVYMSDDTRARLVRAGIELVDDEGLSAVGLRSIARRAAVSHGAPRRYFPTHRALLAEIARSGLEDLVATVGPVLSDTSAASERLVAVGVAYTEYAIDRRAMFELMFRHDLFDGAGGDLRTISLPFLDDVRRVVEDAANVSDTDWRRTVSLWTSVHGIAVLAANRALEPLLASSSTHAIDVESMVRAAVEQAVLHRSEG